MPNNFDANIGQNISSGGSVGISASSNPNNIIWVTLNYQAGTGITSDCTLDGVSMTFITSGNYNGTSQHYYVYAVLNPSAGSHTVSPVFSGSGIGTIEVMVWSGYGYVQSTTPDAIHVTTGSGNTHSGTITTVTNNAWVIVFSFNGAGGTFVPGTNLTSRAGFGNCGVGDSNAGVSPAGSFSQDSSCNSPAAWAFIQIALAPFVAVGPTNVKTWNGVTQSTGIKTYEGVALASVKSVNGVT